MHLRYYLLMIFLSTLSCSERQVEAPLPEKDIVKILADMYLIEAAITGKAREQADSIRHELQELLMEDYRLDSSDLVDMKIYLRKNPEISQELHDRARKRIDHLQRTVN